MSKRVFLLLAVLIVLLVDAFPLYQAVNSKGRLYYTNAFDEAYYLQYDFSLKNQRLSRPGQYLVTLAHETGLSGGWINLVFDSLFVTAFLFLVRALFKATGYDDKASNLASILMTLGPLLFLGSNPAVGKLFYKSLSIGLVSWFAVPEAPYLPIVRSPEPQFSIVVACLGLLFAVKHKRFVYAYLCLPFLYPFIALPLAFVLLALHLRERAAWFRERPALCLAAAFLLLGLLLAGYLTFLAPKGVQLFLVPSRAPCLSFTLVLGLAGYLLVGRGIPAEKRFLPLAALFATLAAENGQVITGWYVDAHNTEQNFGVYAATFLLACAALESRWLRKGVWVIVALSFLLLLHSSAVFFRMNDSNRRRLPLDGELLGRLQADSAHVAINDMALASLASMVFPKQPMTLFSFAHTPAPVTKADLEQYLCAKQQILRDPARKLEFEKVLADMDQWYRHENADFVLISGGRRTSYPVEHDMDALPANCQPMTLHYVLSK